MGEKDKKSSYSTQMAMQQYAAQILRKLPMIDRVSNESEMQDGIMEMLELLGKCTGADRVYIFDRYDANVEYYSNTYEWCASGVHSEKDNLLTLAVEDMPCWDERFRKGETIVIRDLEEIQDTMPLEYVILKQQDIYSEIAAPIYRRNFLCGFIGLDNPYTNVSELFIQQLAFVGAHLSSARDNYYMFSRLEHQIETISAISKIYFLIYRINLAADYFEDVSEGISEDCAEHRLVSLNGRASEKMKVIQRYAAAEYREAVGHFFDLSTIADRLENDESVALDYLAVDGNWHLARFIVQTRSEDGAAQQVLFAIRLISEEKRREKYLIGAMEDANRANEAKSEFLSRMSHDIRTPMNAIVGFTNIAQMNLDNPDKMQECLEKIRMSSDNLQQLIDDVLDLSKIESGELKMTEEPVNLLELCEFYRKTVEGMAEEKDIAYHVWPHDIIYPTVITDSLRLGQIYINLLSNAVKYTPEGGKVDFEVYEELLPESEGDSIRLVSVVRDNGIGMSENFMKEMYSRFSRAVGTRVNKVRGSGLGLAIVKEIVDIMGGRIEVESREQQGTTFRVILELPYLSEADIPDKVEKTAEMDAAVVLPERGLKILIAEDNDLNYEIVEEQLKNYHIQCVRAMDGMECVRMFKEAETGEFDAILMDMQMPVMNGLEAAEIIRSLPKPEVKRIPIIALTANAYQEDIQKCLKAGMNAHLSKPIEIEKLIATICRYMD